MVLGFQDQFCPHVKDGSKRHTIRAGTRWKVGMHTDLFSRVWKRDQTLLFRSVCTRVQTIRIESGLRLLGRNMSHPQTVLNVWIDGALLSPDEAEAFFWSDGFRAPGRRSIDQAAEFWTNSLPFAGQVIHWDYEARYMQRRTPARLRKAKAA